MIPNVVTFVPLTDGEAIVVSTDLYSARRSLSNNGVGFLVEVEEEMVVLIMWLSIPLIDLHMNMYIENH